MHAHIHHAYTCMPITSHAHTNTNINELPNNYTNAIIHETKANLGASCGAPTGAPMEASGVAEGVAG